MGRTSKREKPIFAINASARAKGLGMSGQELAQAARLPYPTVRDIMAGISNGLEESRVAIAKALDSSLAELYSEKQEQKSETGELLREAIGIISALDEHQLERALVGLRAIRGSSGIAGKKKNRVG